MHYDSYNQLTRILVSKLSTHHFTISCIKPWSTDSSPHSITTVLPALSLQLCWDHWDQPDEYYHCEDNYLLCVHNEEV